MPPLKPTKTPDDPTTETFGPVEPVRNPDAERGKYDVPSRPEDDFAIDEQRIRRRVTPTRDEAFPDGAADET